MAEPPSSNTTVSPLAGKVPDGPVTVAVYVTAWPTTEGLSDEVTVVVVGSVASVMVPIVPLLSENHRLPSGAAMMWVGVAFSPSPNVVVVPEVVIRAITPRPEPVSLLGLKYSLIHKLPSGPAAMPVRLSPGTGSGYWVTAPAGVIWPT